MPALDAVVLTPAGFAVPLDVTFVLATSGEPVVMLRCEAELVIEFFWAGVVVALKDFPELIIGFVWAEAVVALKDFPDDAASVVVGSALDALSSVV